MGMLDDQREVFAVAGFRLGRDPNTTSEADLDKMLDLLKQQKPLLRTPGGPAPATAGAAR